MKLKLSFFSLLTVLILSNTTHAQTCGQDCQKANIENYFMSLAKIYREGSSEKDIEDFFKLFHANVKYEHLEYDASFNRNDWLDAFKNNLQRGAYSANQNDGIRVEKYIFGKHHVAVEYSYGQVVADGKWKPKGDQKLFALFGFNGDKIILVREYW